MLTITVFIALVCLKSTNPEITADLLTFYENSVTLKEYLDFQPQVLGFAHITLYAHAVCYGALIFGGSRTVLIGFFVRQLFTYLRQTRLKWSIHTQKQYSLLLKAVITRILIAAILGIFPFFGSIYVLNFNKSFPYPSHFLMMCTILFANYSTFNVLALVYFIKPYRDFLTEKLSIVFCRSMRLYQIPSSTIQIVQ